MPDALSISHEEPPSVDAIIDSAFASEPVSSWHRSARILAAEVERLRAVISSLEAERLAEIGPAPRRRLDFCEGAQKTRYPSARSAKQGRRLRSGDPLRVYSCRECGGWHLTSSRGR